MSGNSSNGGSGFGGGGLGNYQGTITLINSTVSGNTANNVGGGLTGGFGPLTLTSSTITGNSASYGGGVYTEDALTLGNSLIAGNSASVLGPEIRVAGVGTLNSQGHNLFGVNNDSGLSGATPAAT
ncbi:MAG: hypothetical protein HC889_16470, partial [Synechococcaceae cyanobacterium SM1_2_3]|nr:hypothetical protein [Synechococcaceae cyanobacterium SM1_2_3]